MSKKKSKNKKDVDESVKIQNKIIGEGLKNISKHTGLPLGYLANNLDEEKIKDFYESYLEKNKGNTKYNPHRDKEFVQGFEEFISGGDALNDKIKRVITLDDEDEGKLYNRLKRFFRGYEENKDPKVNVGKLKGLADLVSSDPAYQKLTPELAESLQKAEGLVYANNILRVARAEGLLDKKSYKSLSDKVYEASKEHVARVPKHIEDYVNRVGEYSKVAASIIMAGGILTLVSSFNLTGAVIGEGIKSSGIYLKGVALILIAFILLGIKNNEVKK